MADRGWTELLWRKLPLSMRMVLALQMLQRQLVPTVLVETPSSDVRSEGEIKVGDVLPKRQLRLCKLSWSGPYIWFGLISIGVFHHLGAMVLPNCLEISSLCAQTPHDFFVYTFFKFM